MAACTDDIELRRIMLMRTDYRQAECNQIIGYTGFDL